MYSVRSMCQEDLKTELWKKGLDVELRWRTMQVEEKYIKIPAGKDSPDALQIKVASDQVMKARKILGEIYGKTNKEKNTY